MGMALILGKQNLWTEVVNSEYLKGKTFLEYSTTTSGSWIWKAIVDCKPLLLKGLCRRVGKVNTIHFWDDPWIPTISGFKPPRPASTPLGPLMVKDIITYSGGWDLCRISALLGN